MVLLFCEELEFISLLITFPLPVLLGRVLKDLTGADEPEAMFDLTAFLIAAGLLLIEL